MSLAIHPTASRPLPISRDLAWFQLASLGIVSIDFSIRYVLRWKALTHLRNVTDKESTKLSWDDAFAFATLVSVGYSINLY